MTGVLRRTRSGGAAPTESKARVRRGPRKPSGSRSIQFAVLALIGLSLSLLGLVMVLSASAAADEYAGRPLFHLQRQLFYFALGAAALLTTMRIDYRRWRKLAQPTMVLSLVLLAVVLLPGIGTRVNGSRRWLVLGPLRFQPSELAKLALILFLADLLARRWRVLGRTRAALVPALVVTSLVAGLILLEPDLGTVIILGAVSLVMLFLAGVPVRHILGTSVLGSGLALGFAFSASYRRSRIFGSLDPWSDPYGAGYQVVQSQVALATGGLYGTGLGASRAKWGYLPFGHTDFIFAVIAEELGLLGAMVILLSFVALGLVGMSVALRAPDPFGMLLAGGITAWITLQAFVNIGAVLGVLPVTGVTLPFLSFGGSSLVVTMASFGILLNVARHAR